MGRITRNYLYNAAYQLLVILTPIITAPYLARVLGADNLGTYGYVNSSGNIITTCTLLGIFAYGNRQTAYVRDDLKELTENFWEIEFTRLVLGIFGTLVYIGYTILNPAFKLYFILYYPYILAQFIDCTWVFVGLEDMRPAVLKNFVTRLLNVAGIFLLVRKREDLWIYVLLLAMTALITNIAAYTQLRRYIGRPSGNIRKFPTHIRSSIYLFLPQVAALFYLQVDKVMLQWITGMTRQVSFYDHAEKLINIPLSLISVLSTVMMPRIANEFRNNNREEIEVLLQKAGRYALFAALPMMFGLASVAGKFIPWYLGGEFIPVATAMVILSPIVLLNSLSGISGQQYFTATNQINILMKAYVSAAVLNVIVNALLIPRYGYIGAAIATVGSSLISTILQYFYLTRQVRISTLLKCGMRYGAASIMMTVVIIAVTRGMPAGPKTTALQVLVGVVIYLGIMGVTRDETLIEVIGRVKGMLKR
ncbi:MAG TPA: flippase [Lachnospiraceae bacterium]|nr:flippase [Lachnospiraceae bacterium]